MSLIYIYNQALTVKLSQIIAIIAKSYILGCNEFGKVTVGIFVTGNWLELSLLLENNGL